MVCTSPSRKHPDRQGGFAQSDQPQHQDLTEERGAEAKCKELLLRVKGRGGANAKQTTRSQHQHQLQEGKH